MKRRSPETQTEPVWRATDPSGGAAPRDSAQWRELKYQHASQRAQERYGVNLTRWAYWALVNQIRNRDEKRAKRIAKVKPDKPGVAWLVLHGDQWLLAVVHRGLIRTFLPLGTELPDETDGATNDPAPGSG